jgi:ATP synthase I chain
VNLNVNFTRVSGRLAKIIAALAVIGSALAGLRGGWTWAAGFFLGAAASYLNYRNLVQIVRAIGTPASSGRMGAFAWLLFRLILLVAGAFVIIKVTQINVYAACAGLFVPVAAVILEAIFEITYAS